MACLIMRSNYRILPSVANRLIMTITLTQTLTLTNPVLILIPNPNSTLNPILNATSDACQVGHRIN